MSELVPRTQMELEKSGSRYLTNGPGSTPSIMTTRDYIKVLFRQKFVILLTIFTVSAATFIGLKIQTPVYEAQVKMLITSEKQIDSPYYRDVLGGRNVEATLTQSEIVKSNPVLERTIAALGLHKRPLDIERHFASPLKRFLIDRKMKNMKLFKLPESAQQAAIYRLVLAELKANITVEPVRDTNLFLIKIKDYSPMGAAIIANTISRSYVIFDLEQQYVELQNKYTEKNPIVVQMKENITKMEQGLSGQPLPNIEAIGPASVKIIEQASPPLKPIGLPAKVIFILAVVMSIFLGIFLAFMFEFMDQSFHSKQDLESFLGVPVIACINRKTGLGDKKIVKDVTDGNASPRATSYRILAQQLQFMQKTKNVRTLLFSPVHPKEDVSAILVNVGVYLSKRMGLRTLIVDANLRHPNLHKIAGNKNETGLAQVLEGTSKPEELIKPIDQRLDVLTAGRCLTDPGTLLDTVTLGKHLNVLKNSYDMILVEGSNIRDFRDAAIIGPACDGMIVIVGESTVRRHVVYEAIKHLREHNTKVVGSLMPNREYLLPKFLYESV